MKKILSIFILLSLSMQSFSDDSLPASKITKIDTAWSGGSLHITLEGNNVVEGCNSSDTRVVVQKSNSMYDEILSLSLAAFASGKNVVYRISGCITTSNFMNGIAVGIEE